ncbi:unnamed protein product [Caenorhabditis sp. 36 PRJEB53466]|nr:unnamed protein product [Caenorhabditis sp. 36 PRJEB53466]
MLILDPISEEEYYLLMSRLKPIPPPPFQNEYWDIFEDYHTNYGEQILRLRANRSSLTCPSRSIKLSEEVVQKLEDEWKLRRNQSIVEIFEIANKCETNFDNVHDWFQNKREERAMEERRKWEEERKEKLEKEEREARAREIAARIPKEAYIPANVYKPPPKDKCCHRIKNRKGTHFPSLLTAMSAHTSNSSANIRSSAFRPYYKPPPAVDVTIHPPIRIPNSQQTYFLPPTQQIHFVPIVSYPVPPSHFLPHQYHVYVPSAQQKSNSEYSFPVFQKHYLEGKFKNNAEPSKTQLFELAYQLGVSTEKVTDWFEKRRLEPTKEGDFNKM